MTIFLYHKSSLSGSTRESLGFVVLVWKEVLTLHFLVWQEVDDVAKSYILHYVQVFFLLLKS